MRTILTKQLWLEATRMNFRKILLCAVLISIAVIATILSTWRTPDKEPKATNNKDPESSTTSLEMEIRPEDVEPNPDATPEPADHSRDAKLAGLSKAARAEVEKIDAYVKTVDDMSDQRDPDLIFADLSGHAGEKREKWSRFASENALEKARRIFEKTGGSYKIAYNWKNGGRIVGVNVMFSSSSGDWTKDIYQKFREDGSLAFVLTHFGTFYDEYKFEQHKYFDRNGKLIGSFEWYDDMNDKPIEKVKNGEHDRLRDGIDYYMTVSKLPYARLVPKNAK